MLCPAPQELEVTRPPLSRADPNAASSLPASQQGLIAFTCKPFPALLIYYLGAFLVPEVKVKKKKKKKERCSGWIYLLQHRDPGPTLPPGAGAAQH